MGGSGPGRRIGLAGWCATLAWFCSPWSRFSLGQGVRLAFGVALVALVLALLRLPARRSGTVHLPRPARWHCWGVACIVIGTLCGQIRSESDARALLQPVVLGLLALVPLVLLLRLRADDRLLAVLGTAFVLGTVVSVVASELVALGVSPGGRWTGLTGHMNQLGMTIAMSVPLLALALRGSRLRVAYVVGGLAVLALGIQESGSRSAAVAVAVVGAILAVRWMGRSAGRVALIGLLVLAAAVIVPSLGLEATDDTGVIGRFGGAAGAEQSNLKREQLINQGISAALSVDGLIGAGYTFEESPHNVFVETWAAGGVLALTGLAVVFAPPLWRCLTLVRHRHGPLTVADALALSVLGYFVVAFFNNALWFPYTWVILSSYVVAASLERTAPSPLPEGAELVRP